MTLLMTVRKRIEYAFERYGHIIYRNRLKALLVAILVVVALGSQVRKLEFDTSQEGLLRKGDPIRVQYENFRDEFGLDEMIVIAIEPPEVFDIAFLKKLKKFHKALEAKVPYLKEVTSLVNARNTYGDGDVLRVDDLLEDWPEKRKIDLTELKKLVLNNPLYVNNIISEDSSVTAVIIETQAVVNNDNLDEIMARFDEAPSEKGAKSAKIRHFLTGKEKAAVTKAVQKVIKAHRGPGFSPALAGTPVTFDILKRTMMKDMKRNLRLMLLLISISLFFFFRRISGVVLPLIVVISSVVSSLGLMALLKTPFTTPTQIIPTFLITVGVGDAIHVLAIFYKRFKEKGTKEDAVAYALGHSGTAILMTSLTTAAGLLSFSFAEMAPIADVGVYCSFGVILALIYTIIFLPALLALIPIKSRQKPKTITQKVVLMDRVLLGFCRFSCNHPAKIVVASAILAAISIPLIFQLQFTHNNVEWLPDKMKLKQDILYIDKELKGASMLEVVVDTQKENGLYEPPILHGIDKLSREIEKYRDDAMMVGKVFSINDILKETNRALHANDSAYYRIPDDKATISQELFLFENSGSDDLEGIVDSKFSKTRVSVKLPSVDAASYGKFVDHLEKLFGEEFKNKAKITITGLVRVMARGIPASLNSAVKSYIIAFIVIGLMMTFFVGGGKIGVYSLAPNFLPICIVMAMAAVFDMPMDMATIFVGSIVIGLVVDDTIHFIYNFRRYYHENGDARLAIEQSLLTTGRAMFATSICLVSGFILFPILSTMLNVKRFGILITSSIVIALLADFVLAPSLMLLGTRKKKLEVEDRIDLSRTPIDTTS